MKIANIVLYYIDIVFFKVVCRDFEYSMERKTLSVFRRTVVMKMGPYRLVSNVCNFCNTTKHQSELKAAAA